jgi:hypothetical protein
LPKAEHEAEEWQTAMQALLLVVRQNGPTMFARIGVMRALNRYWRQSSNRAHSERAEEFRPTWQCVLHRKTIKTIMGQSVLFLQ